MAQPTLFALALAGSALVSIAAMIWLMLNARSVARIFSSRRGDMVAGPVETPRGTSSAASLAPAPHASSRRVWAAIILFNLGWIGAVLAWSLAADVADNGPPPGTPAPSMERPPPAEPQR